MAKGNNNLTGRRMTTRNPKPYDANNSFVKKVATKVTDLIPQRSWISKWFNSSQGDGSTLEISENDDDYDCDEDMQHPPPLKRPRIRMDITHPPGTFSIQPRTKTSLNQVDDFKQEYSGHHEQTDFVKPSMAGSSSGLITSTPAIKVNPEDTDHHQSDLSTLVNVSNGGANGMDDNSESSESTSGCSSLIPQINRQEVPGVSCSPSYSTRKKFMDAKLNYTNHLQSPRSLFIDSSSRDSLSSRKPSFNASIMTASMSGTSPLSSPFYSGNITFGGANAAGLYKQNSSLTHHSEELKLKIPKRMSVEVKPSNAAGIDSSGMSQTAKKILEALEHFSSPITDAKKIPLKNINNMDGSFQSGGKKRLRSEASPPAKIGMRHMTRELNVPTVPDILRLRRRQKLQDTTAVARKIVSAHNKPAPQQEYYLRTSTDQESKHPARLKAKSKSKLDQENTIEPVDLPNIPLPISTLPTFQFAVPFETKKTEKKIPEKNDSFTFATPIKVTNTANNLKSINNFIFSSPINAEAKSNLDSPSSASFRRSSLDSQPVSDYKIPTAVQNFNWPGTPVGVKLKDSTKEAGKANDNTLSKLKHSCFSATSQYKSDSTDFNRQKELKTLAKPTTTNSDSKTRPSFQSLISERDTIAEKNTSPSRTSDVSSKVWECSDCLIKNSNLESQCVACKASKPSQKTRTSESPSSTLKEQSKNITGDVVRSEFKLPTSVSNQWECSSCYVRNNEGTAKCIACETPKPEKKPAFGSRVMKLSSEARSNETQAAGDSWECTSCKSKNGASASVCPRCNLSRSTSQDASTASKKGKQTDVDGKGKESASKVDSQPMDAGSANTLLNFKPSSDSWECPCCMVRNAATVDSCPCCNTSNPNNSKPVLKKAATPTPSVSGGFGDKFKKPEGSWACDACMVQNKGDVTQCVACTTPKPGAKQVESGTNNSSGSSLKFSFGIPPNAGGFKFGIDNQAAANASTTNSSSGFSINQNQAPIPFGQIKFGIPPEEKKIETPQSSTITTPGFLPVGTINSISQGTVASSDKVDVKQPVEHTQKQETSTFCVPTSKTDSATTTNLQSATDNKPSTQSTPTFTFGITKAKAQDDLRAESNDIGKSTPSTIISTTAPPAELTSNSEKNFKAPTPNPTFSFGITAAISTSATTNTTISSATSLPSVAQAPFAFSDLKANNKTPAASNFGQATAANVTLPSATPLVPAENTATTFASTLTKNAVTEASTPIQSSLFANVPSSTPLFSASQGKTTPVLGGEKPPSFSESATKPSIFSVPDNKLSPFRGPENKTPLFGTKLPMFGSSEKSATLFNAPLQTGAAPAPSGFGTASANPSPFDSSTAPTFGTTSSFGAEPAPNMFATTKANETTMPSANLFTMGASAPQLAQPSFNFSANTNATPSGQKSLFTFGSNANTSQNNVFAGATFNNAAPASGGQFSFNAPKPEASGFAQAGASTGIFGSLPNNSQNQPSFSAPQTNTGYNFGSAATGASAGYNFNPAPPAAGSSEGFSFTPSNGAPTFDPNTRPSFNFTRGSAPPLFNATPQSNTTNPPRKFKVAVRRKK